MSTQPTPFISQEQYLAMEEHAPVRNEYLDGEIFPMEASSLRHVMIIDNLVVLLTRELAGTSCRSFSSTLRTRIAATGFYTYPDIVIICGKPEILDNYDTVANPTALIEVLSPSTQNYHQGNKFSHYRSIPSLREYLILAQDRPHAEQYTRQPNGDWLFHEALDPEEMVALESAGARFKLIEAYANLEL